MKRICTERKGPKIEFNKRMEGKNSQYTQIGVTAVGGGVAL